MLPLPSLPENGVQLSTKVYQLLQNAIHTHILFFCFHIDEDHIPLGNETNLIEADETAIAGKRKYDKGRFHKADGTTIWAQTILEVEGSPTGKRKAKRLRAAIVASRNAETLQANIKDTVHPAANIQTDSWAAYKGLQNHDSVNHKKGEYVKYLCDKKVTTNTLEGTHGALKRMARSMNLFNAAPSDSLQERLAELVYRFNHRNDKEDLFVVFLVLLLSKHRCTSLENALDNLSL